ncbi:zinc ribbon domain-containing protein [Hymenobacter lucidus]|uniref:Zinc ribbon domain-containing protein n=1 Tax=Hymenobacter lucidus TaxID=2880930 RepID=A0ABS8AYL0_9BACT|nr:zinc ribbon domain-containing protein [Hymenobacter lucidus]MCB2410905.1 zinc ribbon domain-containing protein [Hymenobacter lucidus]
MLFFFGLGQSRVSAALLPGVACAYCGTPDSVTATVFSRYFHVFWIPLIPLGKFSLTHCSHCKQTLEKREMPAAYQAPVATLQNSAKLPVSNYLALILLGLGVLFIIGVGLFSRKTSRATASAAPADSAPAAPTPVAEEAAPAALPTAGAVYLMPLDAGRYTLMQVAKATADSVYFRITDPLTGGPGAAKITSALRDSVAPANQATGWSKQQWQTVRQYNKKFMRLR